MTILYADDDADEIDFFCHALKIIDYSVECITAHDGRQALDVLDKISMPDLIFLDLNMPRLNGKECLRLIKNNERLKQIPVVIYSNAASKKDIDELYQIGAFKFLRKHFDIPGLCRELKSLVLANI
jgi:CheY-like chemotaxis protein